MIEMEHQRLKGRLPLQPLTTGMRSSTAPSGPSYTVNPPSPMFEMPAGGTSEPQPARTQSDPGLGLDIASPNVDTIEGGAPEPQPTRTHSDPGLNIASEQQSEGQASVSEGNTSTDTPPVEGQHVDEDITIPDRQPTPPLQDWLDPLSDDEPSLSQVLGEGLAASISHSVTDPSS